MQNSVTFTGTWETLKKMQTTPSPQKTKTTQQKKLPQTEKSTTRTAP